MKNSKIERALYGPSLFEVTLGALLSVSLGAVLAFVFLVLKPVVVAKELPKEEERVQGTVYYLEGSTDATRGRQWLRKRQLLMDGTAGEIALSEEELNAWFTAGTKQADKKPAPKPAAKPPAGKPGAPAQPAAAPEEPQDLLVLEVPNFRIRDSVLQVGIPANLNVLTFTWPVVLQARGTFTKGDDMWLYKPSALYLGSMPLHSIPGLTDLLIKRVLRSGFLPEDAMAGWKRVSNVALDGKQLKLTIPEGAAAAPHQTGT